VVVLRGYANLVVAAIAHSVDGVGKLVGRIWKIGH
jgi:hypothetical protein